MLPSRTAMTRRCVGSSESLVIIYERFGLTDEIGQGRQLFILAFGHYLYAVGMCSMMASGFGYFRRQRVGVEEHGRRG
jgi:hypothetical protein